MYSQAYVTPVGASYRLQRSHRQSEEDAPIFGVPWREKRLARTLWESPPRLGKVSSLGLRFVLVLDRILRMRWFGAGLREQN
jgi:hypothetical protein